MGECRSKTECQSSNYKNNGISNAKPIGYHDQCQNNQDEKNVLNKKALHEVNLVLKIVKDPGRT